MGLMRCLSCGYALEGLTEDQCPECGQSFDARDPSTYDSRPPFLFWRFWTPGILIVFLIGFLGFAGLQLIGSSGFAIWIGVPVAMGAGTSIYTRSILVVKILFGLFVITGLLALMYTMDLAGMYCTLILFVIILIPFGLGMILGRGIRGLLKDQSRFFRAYLPAILLCCMPYVWHYAGGSGKQYTTELSVTTSRVIIGDPDEVWDALMYFEDVDSTPPLLMRIALPRPLYSTGSMDSIGDRRVCVYTKGRLAKEIVEIEDEKLLGFRVVEQEFEPSVILTGGRFVLEELEDGETKITLTTDYIPVHSPRLAWRWAEVLGARTLHTHVINGIESQVTEQLEDITMFDDE